MSTDVREVPIQTWQRRVRTSDGQLLHVVRKAPAAGALYREPIVFVHGFVQNCLSWDLPGRSLQDWLVQQGFDTFNFDMRGHSGSRELGSGYASRFEDYFELDLPAVVDHALAETGAQKAFLMAHSLGGPVAYAACVRSPRRYAGLISVAGATHFGRGTWAVRTAGRLYTLARRTPLVGHALHPRLPVFGDLAGRAASAGFPLLDSRKNPIPVEGWQPGSTSPDVMKQRVREGWDRTSTQVWTTLMRWCANADHLSDDGRQNYSAELCDLHTPTLFVVGSRDSMTPLSSIQPGFQLCGAEDKSLILFHPRGFGRPYGHLDLICGDHAPAETWPSYGQWLAERAERRAPVAQTGAGDSSAVVAAVSSRLRYDAASA